MRSNRQASCEPSIMKQKSASQQTRSPLQATPQSTAPTRLRQQDLKSENCQFQGTGGVSEENREQGFIPAFHDQQSGHNVISSYADGTPAPIHVIDGLPAEWIVEHDETGHALATREGVIAGFLRNGIFYTREEAARAA